MLFIIFQHNKKDQMQKSKLNFLNKSCNKISLFFCFFRNPNSVLPSKLNSYFGAVPPGLDVSNYCKF